MPPLSEAPAQWRSLAELEGRPEFVESLPHEFAEPEEPQAPSSPERRRFLQILGASAALAGCRWEKDYLVPEARRPEGTVPGVPRHFASVMDLGGTGYAVRVKSWDGRPIKVEGNPSHPSSRGATTAFAQAAILEVYDPDRSRAPKKLAGSALVASTWEAFEAEGRQLFDAARAQSGRGLRFLSTATSSPTLTELVRRLREGFPQAKW